MIRRLLAASLAALMLAGPGMALAQTTSTYEDTTTHKKAKPAHAAAPKKAAKAPTAKKSK